MGRAKGLIGEVFIPPLILLLVCLSILGNALPPESRFWRNEAVTPLCLAVYQCELDKVKILISQGADVNHPSPEGKKLYPVHFARNIDVLDLLMKNGANLNVFDKDGNTPLHYSRDHRWTKVLVDKGADVLNANIIGETPLFLAAGCKTPLPIAYDSIPNYYYCLDSRMLEYLVKKVKKVNTRNNAGQTPLHYAVYAENIENIKTLLKYGADVSLTDDNGYTPLDMITQKKTISHDKRISENSPERSYDDKIASAIIRLLTRYPER